MLGSSLTPNSAATLQYLSCDPVFYSQASNTRKFAGVMGDQNQAQGMSMAGQRLIIGSDWSSGSMVFVSYFPHCAQAFSSNGRTSTRVLTAMKTRDHRGIFVRPGRADFSAQKISSPPVTVEIAISPECCVYVARSSRRLFIV